MTATPGDAAPTAPATTGLPAMAVARTEPTWTDDMPIFMAPAWLGSQGAEFGWLEARPTPDLHIAVPFVGRRRVGLRWLQFQWGVWSSRPIDLQTERAFLEGAVLQCRADGFDFITQPATMALFRTAPAGAASAPFGTVLVDLSVTEEELWGGLTGRNRAIIRKAKSLGVSAEWGSHLADEAHALCAGTMARSGLSFPGLSEFRALVEGLGDALDIGVARFDGAPKACVVNPWSRFGAHCLFAGTADSPTQGAANLLQWEAMLRAHQHGAGVYDFVGVRLNPEPDSKYAGLLQFKTRFGGEVIERFLWKMPLNEWKYALYGMMRRMRGDAADIIDQVGQTR
ncbi:MAG: peptidoglycan bridge formation glycyltransferase FemA/FemB family protein [Coriobacteriia bacterium]|nr:peptidoglycan bridge formation glycyltransferase FemA/FemB family protein [Coriobacteriia bacterium]